MSSLLIAGAGGHGRVVADAAEASGKWSAIAFIDDKIKNSGTTENWPLLGGFTDVNRLSDEFQHIVVAIGDNQARLKWISYYAQSHLTLATVIHPDATVSPRAVVGAGTVIFAGAVINIGANIGSGCIINTGAVVDHDCQLGDAVHISPGASLAGNVTIGDCSWIGIGASVRQQIRLGKYLIVGAGAAVVDNFGDEQTLIGVPAKSVVHRD